MSNSTRTFDQLISSQASKEVTANAMFDACSPASVYGRRETTCTGLYWGFYGGNVTLSGGTMSQVTNGTLLLTGSTTNYVVAQKSDGVVSASTATTNWNDSTNYWRLYSIVTGSASVTSYTDSREIGKLTGGGGGTGSAITAKDEGSNLTTALSSLDFVGAGVVATNTGGAVTVTIAGSSAITAKDEGSNLTTALSSLDFVGAGVVATNTGGAVTVTIAGSSGREFLAAARTYYVRTDGSDSNNGLANSSGGAFLTIQKAIDVASAIDNGGYDITISIVAGTYTATNVLKSFVGSGRIILIGNTADMTSTVISTTSADCFSNGSGHYGLYHFEYLKLQTTTTGSAISCFGSGAYTWKNVAFGACASIQIIAGIGVLGRATGNYTVNGNATNHIGAYDGGQIRVQSVTVTVSGTPVFSDCFASAGRVGTILANNITFSGSATGKRYDASLNGILYTNGGGANYFPGNSAGTTSTGGQYV